MRTIENLNIRQLLILIIVIAVLFRVLAALYLGQEIVALPGTHDQISYDALAQSLLAGQGFSFRENWYPFTLAGEPTAHWSFLYPLFLAGVYQLAGYQPVIARLLQASAGGAIMSLLVFYIGSHLAGQRVGLLATALTAVYGYFIYYSAALMTETFFIIAMLSAVLITLQLSDRATLGKCVSLGVALGIGTLLRQTMVALIPVFILWLAWEKRRDLSWKEVVVPPLVVVLMILPWTLRNQRVYGEFLPLNSNAGYALYAANHPDLGSEWNSDQVVVPIPDEMRGMNEAQLNNALTEKAIEFVIDDPGRYVLLGANKGLEYFKFWPSATSSTISNLTRVLSFGLYLPFMLAGLIISFSRWRTYLLIYLVVAAHTMIYLMSWSSIRYRLPVDALLIPLASLALIQLAQRVQLWRKVKAFA